MASSMFFRKRKVGPEYYFERGEECLNDGNYPWAIESFTKAIEYIPDFEMAYYNRAEAYMRLGRTREAMWDYIKFLEVDHRGPGMAQNPKEAFREAVNIARLDWQRNKVKDKILSFGITNLLEELVKGFDPEGEYIDTRFYDLALSWLGSSLKDRYYAGFVHLLKKDFDKAIIEFDKVIEESPENPDAYYFNGVALLGKMKLIENRGSRLRSLDMVKELSGLAYSNFEKALKRGFKWRMCPECGFRISSTVNYCMRCGKLLLVG